MASTPVLAATWAHSLLQCADQLLRPCFAGSMACTQAGQLRAGKEMLSRPRYKHMSAGVTGLLGERNSCEIADCHSLI
eukprot:364072-Chlamydomonas_euryale.AAC.9